MAKCSLKLGVPTNSKKSMALINSYWDKKLPINPEFFAAKLGLRVTYDTGMGFKSGRLDGKTIHINASFSPIQRRFAIAREVGRFVLGHESVSGSDWVHDSEVTKREGELDVFAEQLLMPAVAIKVVVEKMHVVKDEELASIFGVSRHAIYMRMKKLGYFLFNNIYQQDS